MKPWRPKAAAVEAERVEVAAAVEEERVSTAAAVEAQRIITAADVEKQIRRMVREQRVLYFLNLALLIWLASKV